MGDVTRFNNVVAGARVPNADDRWIASVNPYTGAVWAEIPQCGPDDVDRAVTAAHRAFSSGAWPALTATGRGKLLRKLGDLIARDASRLAEIEVADNGKLLAEMGGQVRYIPEWFYYYGGMADKMEGTVPPIDKPAMFTYTRREPLGVVVAITPWNSPLLLLTWKLAPALAAGNTIVIKPSEFTSASTLALMDLVEEAGFPKGVINTVTGYGHEIGTALVEHPLVAKVAFTGGDATGAAVYANAAKGLKSATLELGGKSANIIFEDANLDNAVKGAIAGIFAASGQTCIAGSRLLVQRSVCEDVSRRVVEFARRAKLGNPMDAETQVGPITTAPQREKILSYIDVARGEGARCLLGGGIPERADLRQGYFVEPTIFGDVNNDMRIAREEVFGPVLSIIPFDDEDQAVEIANDSPYGLGAGLWTSSMRRTISVADRLKAGSVWVNTYRAVSYMAPFGGYKRSGIGRESGKHALDDYLQTKTVWINLADDFPDPFVLR